MSSLGSTPPVRQVPNCEDIGAIDAFRKVLISTNFTSDGIRQHLGEDAVQALSRDQATPALRALEHHQRAGTWTGLSTLILLFILARPVPEELFQRTVLQADLAQWVALGLVQNGDDGHIQSTVDLDLHAADDGLELWVAADLTAFQRPEAPLPHDYVLGIGGASLTLAQITERRPVRRAVDIGTGCGVQVFHLLGHADHVVATDLCPRALAFARFNLLLNAPMLGLDPHHLEKRVDLRQGSLLEPIAREEFDLVVTNPPFVITPRNGEQAENARYTYRDGGRSGDLLVAELLGELDTIMAPGATAHLLANWEIPRSQGTDRWSHRLESWVSPTLDVWGIQRDVQTPQLYAETWLRDAAEHRDRAAYEAAYAAYLDDFAERDVEAVGFGYVRLEKPREAREPRRVWESLAHPLQQPIAQVTAATMQRWDVVDALEQRWVDLHLKVADDVTEERHLRPGAEDPSLIVLRQGSGLQRSVVLTSATAGLVGACDGELSVRQIVVALGDLLGWVGPAEESEEGQAVLKETRHLLINGFLYAQ
ncbi:MAG: methyltransferase [Kocuria sp.]|nr:methyltransferase [Kocuria sp.]